MASIEEFNIALITANVGSLFEDPIQLLKPWLQEFLHKIGDLQPKFVALHLQEVGGKTYDKSMEYVQQFIQSLCEAEEMRDFTVIRIYMDEDFNSAEHFTALGNMYFVHKELTNLQIWNFLTHDWENASDKSIYSGNIECVPTKEKAKFPQHFFPECKWSRKGFMRTRWQVNGTVFDLVNIHLFHDASNLAACEEFPSVYCKTRRRALVHTLERFHLDDKNGFAPYFVFGDFNFRCDTEGVIKELTQNLTVHRMQSFKSDSTKLHYRNAVGDNVLTVGKKEFTHADHQLKFKEGWLKKHDRELEALSEVLVEYPIEFSPSYPYEEDPEMPTDYMSTRCPSWCDRILMCPQAKQILSAQTVAKPYSIIGENVCMGDHKPIYLSVNIMPNQGHITYSKQVPESLSRIVKAVLVDDDIWREQSSYVEDINATKNSSMLAKSHYVQIKPLIVSQAGCNQSDRDSGGELSADIIVSDAADGDCGDGGGGDGGGGGGGNSIFQITSSQPTEFSILKETTV